MTALPEENWISLSEAARRLGISRRTLNALLEDSDIKLLHLKRNIRVDEADLGQLDVDPIKLLHGKRSTHIREADLARVKEERLRPRDN